MKVSAPRNVKVAPGGQPDRSGLVVAESAAGKGDAFMASRRFIKRAAMWLFCHRVTSARFTTAVFRATNLRSL